MPDPLRILYVDDSPYDRTLVSDVLEKKHGAFAVTLAASKADFEARLADGTYDVVLSDFNILGFDGLQVLDAVRAKDPTIPVILVTGTGSEEVAVEALKRGAADYVIKTLKHIQRLPHTILAVLEKKRLDDERMRAEEALCERESLLGLFIEHAPAALAMFDREMRYLYASRRWLNDYGLGIRNLRGQSHYDVFPEIPEAWKEAHRRGMAGEVLHAESDRFKRADGSVQWLRWDLRPWYDPAGTVGGIVIFTEDITERKRLEEQRDQLARRLLEVQEEERCAVARDLHDEIGQSLTAVKVNLQRVQLTEDKAEQTGIVTDALRLADQVLRQVRDLSLRLHPELLDDMGLTWALQGYAEQQAQRAGLELELAVDPDVPPLPRPVEIACFRIAQEAMTNAIRHAEARRLWVVLEQVDGKLALRVRDDGRGCSEEAILRHATESGGLGIAGMRERARLLGGEVHLTSPLGCGTEVLAILPLTLPGVSEGRGGAA
jgi:two-component system sensor histidine kinase UhpB